MKKTIIITSMVAFTLFACKNPLKPDASLAEASNFSPADSISAATALSMIAHYADSVVNHSVDSIIRRVSLHNSDLFEIFKFSSKQNPITKISFFAAAYLSTDPIVARRNLKTVLVQIKKGYNSEYFYYDVQSFGAGRLCPPPMGCTD